MTNVHRLEGNPTGMLYISNIVQKSIYRKLFNYGNVNDTILHTIQFTDDQVVVEKPNTCALVGMQENSCSIIDKKSIVVTNINIWDIYSTRKEQTNKRSPRESNEHEKR
ncbi:hypothetical protein HHI36_009223 [Cryptolaemus montrouzieri]|uniref:Reverse transcriptase domain-containing protein n=1 Tax=Cryptolaemus montrouzieri TaxID=559131 RepID=A0ABD2MUW5_9CUCU